MRALIRADANTAIGTGHVMRMLALAGEIRRSEGEVCMASLALDAALERRLTAGGVQVVRGEGVCGSQSDALWLADQASRGEFDWIVVDGYAFDERYQQTVQKAGIPLLAVDDFGHNARQCAQLVLNQNPGVAPELHQQRAPHTDLLLGPRYALLRPEFARARPARLAPPPEQARRILLTMGGADPVHATAPLLRAIAESATSGTTIHTVVGPSHADPERLEGELRGAAGDVVVELLRDVEDMTEPMLWADLAVSAAGTTALELCCLGVPSALIVLVDNQVGVARGLADHGACENLGKFEALLPEVLAARLRALCGSRERRRAMAEAGRALVDGRGSARVVAAMEARRRGLGA